MVRDGLVWSMLKILTDGWFELPALSEQLTVQFWLRETDRLDLVKLVRAVVLLPLVQKQVRELLPFPVF